MPEPRFEGKEIVLGGTTYVVPPFSLKALRKIYGDKGPGETPMAPMEMLSWVSAMLFSALQRNYPAITTEEVEDLVDTRNMGDVMEAIHEVNGFASRPTAPVQAPPTGGESSPTSAPAPAGPGTP